MAILIRKYQNGGPTSHIYESAEEASKNPIFKGIPLTTIGIDGKKITRCFGAVKDVNAVCGFNSREILQKTAQKYPETIKQVGRVDNEIDSWDLRHVAKKSEDIDFLYDREAEDNDATPDLLNNLPLGTIIATGDARGTFVNKNLPNRVSRHTITVAGHTTSGKPIIYDLGHFYEGIPEKYLKESKNKINFIIAPKGSYKTNEQVQKEEYKPVNMPLKQHTELGVDGKQSIELVTPSASNYGDRVQMLLFSIFGKKQRQQ